MDPSATPKGSDPPAELEVPFSRTIENIHKIRGIESMVKKLEYLFRLFTRVLPGEISEFWAGTGVQKEKLFVDADSLKGIVIYVVVRAK